MIQNPRSNAPGPLQPWIRWVENDLRELAKEDNALRQLIKTLTPSADKVAPEFTNVYYEINKLYTTTGNPYPPEAPPAPPAPTVTYSTREYVADWSRTWGTSSYYTGSSTHVNGQYLYQGSNPENKIGIFHFAIGSAAGKTITDAKLFVQNIDSPFQSSFTAAFGTHGYNSAPTGKPTRHNGWNLGWRRGLGQWIAIPKSFWAGISNGSIDGFSIGGMGASNPNYAYFQGVGMSRPPRMKLTYKN